MEEEEEKYKIPSFNLDEDLIISSPEEKSVINNVKSKKSSKSRKQRTSSKPKLDLITGNYDNNKTNKKSDKKYEGKSSDVTLSSSSEKYEDPEVTYPSPITNSIPSDKKEKKRSNDALSSNLTNFIAKKKKTDESKSSYKYHTNSSNTLNKDISTHPPQNNPIIDITQSPITTNSRNNSHSRNHSNRRNRNRSVINNDEVIAHRLQNEEHSEVTPTFASDEEYARYLQRKENESRNYYHDMNTFYDMDRFFSRHFNYSFDNNFYNEVNPISFAPLALSIFNANSRTNFLQQFLRNYNNNTFGNGTSNPRNLMLLNRDFNENDYEMLLQLDDNIKNNKGASQLEIDCLENYIIKDSDKESCCICLTEMEPKLVVKKLPCGHLYHLECISNWLKINSGCTRDKKRIHSEKGEGN